MSYPLLPFPNTGSVCPVDALPPPLRDAVLVAIIDKGAPPGVALTDAIAAAGAMVHCGYDAVTPDGEQMATTINTCSTADSGSGKGRSIKLFFRHFLAANRNDIPVTSTCANDSSSAAYSLRSPTNMMSKPSFRALIDALNGHGANLTIQREEGTSFLKTDLFRKDTDALAQLWSGDPPLDHVVHGKRLVAVDARCSLGFRIQPFIMDEYLNKRGRNSYRLGLWPRTIASCHDPDKFPSNGIYIPPSAGNYSTHDYDRRMQDLASSIEIRNQEKFSGRIPVELHADAKSYMLELRYRMKEWTKPFYFDIREAAGRAWENTLRLAAVMHVFCVNEGKVSCDYVARAWAIVEWSLSQHRLIFVDSPRAQNAGAMMVPNSQARPMRISTPKIQKLPRPLQDANWFLSCLGKHSMSARTTTVRDVNLLAGLSPKRLETVLAWLEMERLIVLTQHGAEVSIKLLIAPSAVAL